MGFSIKKIAGGLRAINPLQHTANLLQGGAGGAVTALGGYLGINPQTGQPQYAGDNGAFIKMADEERARKQAAARPGQEFYTQTQNEARAGVNPVPYEGVRDVKTGELLGQYRYDPYAGEASQALKQQAFAQGESPWAALQRQLLASQTAEARDTFNKENARNLSEAQSSLARFGGLSSGARNRAAMESIRAGQRGGQNLARNAVNQGLGIGAEDINRKQNLLGNFADLESKGQEFNINQLTGDLTRRSAFDSNRYNEQMRAWAAAQSANAQRQASGGGKK